MNLFLALQRIRHAHGFGIHSPSAFKFVTEILRTPYSYYAYDEIDGSISKKIDRLPRMRHYAHLIHRIASRQNFNLCIIVSPAYEFFANAVRLADSRLEVCSTIPAEIPDKSLMLLHHDIINPHEAALIIRRAAESLILMNNFNPKEIEKMTANAETGFNLIDQRFAIVCRTGRMKFVSYETRL